MAPNVPAQLAHAQSRSHVQMQTHAHTDRGASGWDMSDPITQVHDVQLTSDSQLIGQNKIK